MTSGITADKVSTYDGYADQIAAKADASALATKANASDLTTLAGRVTQTETDIGTINSSAAMTSGITADKVSTYDGYADQIAAKADASALATKANASDLTTLAGRVTQTETDIGTINSSAVMTSGITADKVSTYDGYASQIAAKADVSALSNYVQTSALTTTLADYATTANVYSKTDADNKFATQTSISDMLTKTEAGTTYATKTEISGLLSADTAASTYATQTALNTLSDAVSAKADASALSNYVQTSTLTTTLADYATTDSVYSKTDADNKFATQTALNTLSDTVAGKADASALASKADASDLTALAGRVTQTETDIGIINSSAAMTSGITADKVSTYDGYASQIAAKQDALTTDQMALLNSGITAEDVANMSGMGTRLTTIENDYLKNSDKEALSSAITTAINNEVSARNTAISDAASQISADFAAADATTLASAQSYADTKTTLTSGGTHYSAGSVLAAISSLDSAIDTSASLIGDIANLEATYAGNLAAKGSPVAAHLAAIDARLGHIHGLASTLSNSAGKMNLAQNSTVEDHLVALAGAIGDRTNYSEQNVISNNQTVAQSLDSLDVAVGDIQRNMTTAQATNNARFERIESKINKLDDKINKGLAANNALAGLVPLDRCHQTQISAAMGGYRDNQALAVGAFHYVNDRILLNAGAAYGGNSSISYKVGVTFGF